MTVGHHEVVTDGLGNRLAVGATTIADTARRGGVLEEFLDWRPYDHLTDLGTHAAPERPVKKLKTIEFEPTATGTVVHFRYAPPETEKGRSVMLELEPMYRRVFEVRLTALAYLLDAELAKRDAEQSEGPELLETRADGALAALVRDLPL